jgi:hypothetical protein
LFLTSLVLVNGGLNGCDVFRMWHWWINGIHTHLGNVGGGGLGTIGLHCNDLKWRWGRCGMFIYIEHDPIQLKCVRHRSLRYLIFKYPSINTILGLSYSPLDKLRDHLTSPPIFHHRRLLQRANTMEVSIQHLPPADDPVSSLRAAALSTRGGKRRKLSDVTLSPSSKRAKYNPSAVSSTANASVDSASSKAADADKEEGEISDEEDELPPQSPATPDHTAKSGPLTNPSKAYLYTL